MNSLYTDIIELLAKDQPVVLARIIRQTGSAPRSVGTACLILSDGSILGTIGGGALEYQTIQKAADVMDSQRSAVLEFRLTGDDVADSEMLCGGLVDVYLEPVSPANAAAMEVFHKTAEMLNAGRQGVLVTRIADGTSAEETGVRALVQQDGSVIGSITAGLPLQSEGLKELLGCKNASMHEPAAGLGDMPLFVEPVKPDSVLYLFGAGHVSTFVAPLAAMADFRVVVIDDREEFANPTRFPQADSILICPIPKAFEKIEINQAAYIAIITRGHQYDHEVLAAALNTQPAYIGMIGSLRKRNLIYRALIQDGVSPESIARIHSPIGLAIGAETPEQIAVSIVAELIHVRALAPIAKTPFESNQPV